MRRTALAATSLAAILASTPSFAVNLVTNGSFENGYVQNTEFGASYPSGAGPTGWSSPSKKAYNLYFDPATATTVNAASRFGGNQKLHSSFTGASPDGGKFVALDGDVNARGPLMQLINGLTPGKNYAVSFYWGAAQLDNRRGPTTEQLDVTFGTVTKSTPVLNNPSKGFTGWFGETLNFKAASASQYLSFLSIGTPTGLPPMAVLDGVSVTTVPEPAAWTMLILGFGWVGLAVRRRAQASTVTA